MSGLASHFFDGEASDLDKFTNRCMVAGLFLGKKWVRDWKITEKYPNYLATGVQWSKGFIKRNDL